MLFFDYLSYLISLFNGKDSISNILPIHDV